jgi:ABC-2 type transport system permease protein
MRACIALLMHSARRARTLLLAAAILLAAFQILLTTAAQSLQELNTFAGLTALIPDFLRQVFGSSLLTIMSFRGIACLGFFHVAIVAFLVGLMIALATEPAREAETRFLDLILAHPVARAWIITRTVVLMAACIVLLLGAMTLGTWAGLHWLAKGEMARETFAVIPRLGMNFGLLLLCWGGISLALSTIVHRRSVAASIAAMLALACYMTDIISQVWKPLKPLAHYSPFHYYNALNLITGTPNSSHDLYVLACIAAAGCLISYLLFQLRDI